MDTSYEDDEEKTVTTPLFSIPGIPAAIPDHRKPHQKQLAVYIILASTLFERIAFYTLAANLAFNLESDKVKPKSSLLNPSTIGYIFSGISYISTIIFAVISDWKLGRARTIILGFSLYLAAYIMAVLVTSGTIDSKCSNLTQALNNGSCSEWIYATLITISVSAGAVQSNMAVFGAEQIQESKLTSHYFDRYVVITNISAIIAVVVIRRIYNLGNYLTPSYIACSSVGTAVLLFFAGWRYYIHVPPFDTVLTNFIPVIINACQSRRRYKKNKDPIDEGQLNFTSSDSIGTSHYYSEEQLQRGDERPHTFLEYARVPYGKFSDRVVNDVKSLRKAFIVFTSLIPFLVVCNQLNSTFALQANYMNGDDIDSHIVTYMWLGNPIAIIIGVLILNLFVYKYLDARKRSLTIPTRFIIGMCFAITSMCAAGTVEVYRQNGCNQTSDSTESSLSIFFQLPQNILMGIAELFAMVASFEYAYFAAPRSAQTLFMSLRFCSLGISSFLNVAYMAALANPDTTLDFKCTQKQSPTWRFYSYFFILGGIQLIFTIVFIISQKKFKIIKINPQQTERNQFLR